MRGFVDKDICIGCGCCEGLCPEIFEIEDDGLAFAKDIEIFEDIENTVRDAYEGCPVGAISLRY